MMRFFIFSITLLSQCFMAYCKAETNLDLPLPHMVIVGGTGVGKSSLAMALIGGDVTCDNCTFPICWETDSCTKQTSYAVAPWLGNPDNQNFTIVDTPGFSDSDGEMDKLVEEMIDILNNEVQSANAIILAMDSTETRFTDGVSKMLGELEALFGTKMWNNTIIEMTKFSYEADEIVDREEECDKNPEHCKDEVYWYTEMNRQLEEKFHIGMKLPMVFIDSWSQKDKDEDDPIEEEHFINETQKLWDFAMSHDAFEFKGIDEVLDENEKLRSENEELNATNADLNNKVDSLEHTIDAQEHTIEDLNNTIKDQQYTIKDLNLDIERLNGEIEDLNDDIDDYVKNSDVRGIFVLVGDDGCNVKCEINLKLTFANGKTCTTGNIKSSRNDWRAGISYAYWWEEIGECNRFYASSGVSQLTVTHSGHAVQIDYWRILTNSGVYYCDGNYLDDSVKTTTCWRE